MSNHSPAISIVVPVYNEVQVLPEFHRQLTNVVTKLEGKWEVIYVDDGSVDKSYELLQTFEGEQVAIVKLSRNFGKETAMTAGLDVATGDAVVVIDADLQDPPELIPELVAKWREGYDVVYGVRRRMDNRVREVR